MTTPGNSKRNARHMDNGVMDSIAALRSVLMLETPIRNALAVGRNNATDRKLQQTRKLPSFSPTSMTQATTPASRNTEAQTPVSSNKTFAGKRLASSLLFHTPSPSKMPRSPEVQQSATKVMEKKIQLLEASHAELEQRLKGEIDQRTTLKTIYEKLSKFQSNQSSQLEQITVSRNAFRNESIALKKTLERERNNRSKTIAFLQSSPSDTMQSERFREEGSLRVESERLKKRLQKADSRYAESELLVKSLTTEVQKLNADLMKLRQNHESAIQNKIENHKEEMIKLKDKLDQMESSLVEQINNERKGAEEANEKLQKVQKNRSKLKEEYSLEVKKNESEKSNLRESLEKVTDARIEAERKLEEGTNEISRFRQQVEDAQLARKDAEEKVKDLSVELDAAKEKLVNNDSLQFEKDELENQLRDAKQNSWKIIAEQDQPNSVAKVQELQSENKALQQQLNNAEENRSQFQNELQETQMELDGLKQNLEEAERIELQNEELVARLKSLSDELARAKKNQEELKVHKTEMKAKDELSEITKPRTNPTGNSAVETTNNTDANNNSVTIHDLKEELGKVKNELANTKEKLGISRTLNEKRLLEVATHRDKVRDLEHRVEELEDQSITELPEEDCNVERKRENEVVVISSKRLKAGEGALEGYGQDIDDDDIVL